MTGTDFHPPAMSQPGNAYAEYVRARAAPARPETCMGCLTEAAVFTTNCCSEPYCAGCAKAGLFRSNLSCPREACGKVQDAREVARLEGVTPEWLAVRLARSLCLQDPSRFPCRGADCRGYLVASPDSPVVPCPRCDLLHCGACRDLLGTHGPGGACSSELGMQILRERGCKRCPNRRCRTYVEKEPDTCNCVACNACGWYFCWLCGELMERRTVPFANERAHAHFYEVDPDSEIPGYSRFARPSCTGLVWCKDPDEYRRRNDGRDPYDGFGQEPDRKN